MKNKTLTDLVAEYFKQIGGIAVSPFIGKVLLDKAGADDSLAHGMGRRKAIAYASVKEVIENGIIIGFDRNHKDRGYNSVVFAAPINISNERFICYVVVKINQKENRFYLHEVWAEKNLTNVRSNTAQKQPSHQQGNAMVIENILNAKNNASKILDENGEPLIVYHGIGQWLEEFKPNAPKHSRAPEGAYYFTDNKEIANSFVPGRWYGVSRGEKSCFL